MRFMFGCMSVHYYNVYWYKGQILQRNSRDLIEGRLIITSVIELGGVGAGMSGHRQGVSYQPTAPDVGGTAGSLK